MTVAASRPQQFIGVLMLVAALAYLVPFVPRGWIPHDEGMLGQSADRVLLGGIPHVDYEEAYTGGLTWLYAAVFKATGVDLLHLRWLLFAGAAGAAWFMYAIFRRYLRPIAAGFAMWVAVAWSFPNYFAGLPSWWLLICALACIWAVVRYLETAQLLYIAAAGLAAGVAMATKQTGVYLLVALVLTLVSTDASSGRLARWAIAITALIFAAAVLWPRISGTEGVYLFLPAAAVTAVLLVPMRSNSGASLPHSPLVLVVVATAAAAVPLALLLVPYVLQNRLWDFVNGAIVLPRKRLAFASAPMRGAWMLLAGVPLVALIYRAPRWDDGRRSAIVQSMLWSAAIVLPLLALWNVASYQAIWQSSRAFAALIPLAICWRLVKAPELRPEARCISFLAAATLAWMSLNQFPFAAPIYFSYVTPLAVIAGVVAADAESSLRRGTMLPWAAMLLLFAVLSLNRGYIETLGVAHDPRRFDTALRLPRAHLKVSARDAAMYRRLVVAISPHLRGGLIAGPDCPQVYFLAGVVNPSGALFDFFSTRTTNGENEGIAAWAKGSVVVLNHEPHFSPALSGADLAMLRKAFEFVEYVGPFEVRWR